MKTETKYICEKCGWKYNTEEECQKCEDSHNSAKTLVAQKFDHKFGESAKYPGAIIVQMANGHKIEYRYYKPILDKSENNTPPTDPTTDPNTDPNAGNGNNG